MNKIKTLLTKIYNFYKNIYQNIKNYFNLNEEDDEMLRDFLVNLFALISFTLWIIYFFDIIGYISEYTGMLEKYKIETTKYQQNSQIITELKERLNSKLNAEISNNVISIVSIVFSLYMFVSGNVDDAGVNNVPKPVGE